MRSEVCAVIALLVVPVSGYQRGVVSGIVMPKTPIQAGLPVAITITGTNPCGAVRINPGDATDPITHPLTQVPATVQYVYQKPGRFELRAEGMGNCDGVASTSIQVNPASAPPSPPVPPPPPRVPPPAGPSSGGVRSMDADQDGVVTRAEWRGTEQTFRRHDTNGDGVLSGAEVRRDEPGEVIVKAAERWTSTGVSVRAGDVVRIESAGTVQLSADAADTSSPGGAGSGRRAPSAPMPDHPAGGLIARIGNSRPLFVGADPILRANASGQLFLGVNDDHLVDNRGEFRVKVEPPSRGRQPR